MILFFNVSCFRTMATPYNWQLFYQYSLILLISILIFWSQTDLLIRCWKCKKLAKSAVALLINMALCAMCGAYGIFLNIYLISMLSHTKDGKLNLFDQTTLPKHFRLLHVLSKYQHGLPKFYTLRIYVVIDYRQNISLVPGP
jgi:hypothetical protein